MSDATFRAWWNARQDLPAFESPQALGLLSICRMEAERGWNAASESFASRLSSIRSIAAGEGERRTDAERLDAILKLVSA